MRPSIRILSLVATFIAAVAHGGEVTVRFDALGDLSELPEGWTTDGVTLSSKTAAYKGGLQFGGVKHWLRSPRFGAAIEKVSAWYTYNMDEGKTATRYLTLHPFFGDVEADGLRFNDPRWATSYQEQVFSGFEEDTDEFIIRLEGTSRDGNWYVKELTVLYDEDRPVSHEEPIVPRPEVGSCLISNCWKVSGFGKVGSGNFVREADFSLAEKVKVKSAWTNGVSVDSFYAFSGGVAVSNIYPSTYKSSPNGLYAALMGEDDLTVCALGLQATDEKRVELLLPIALDAGRKVGQLTVEFRGWVPKVGENPTTLMFHWCAVDSLDAIEFADWIAVSDGYYSGVENGSQLMILISGRDFKGRKFIGLKWSVKNQAKSSLLAISDLRVTADLDQPGFALLVR